ncbi:MAG: GWxTD domain-containing protein [Balneola sp.]|nr:MAG: GWxTD domain-containing protein [Balneola sp.]
MQKRFILIVTLLFVALPLLAQRSNRVNYTTLMNRANAPQIFIDEIVLPNEDGNTNLSVIFRFDNDFLPYKKISPSDDIIGPEGMEYFTIVRLNSEIFKGKYSRRRSATDVGIATRDLWVDTLYTKTFEETESKGLYASGSLTNILEPGEYNYVLQLSLMENTRERNSNRQNIRIWDWEEKKSGEVYLIKEGSADSDMVLMNMNDNVLFGKDFKALVRIPNYSEDAEYTLNVHKARTVRRDTIKVESIYSKTIGSEEISSGVIPVLEQGIDPTLRFKDTEMNFTYVLLDIPNKEFENAAYMIEVTSSTAEKPIAKSFFRSYWPNMPASLLNLDIALNNMQYIVSETQLKELKSGSSKEKEEKFRAFWESRDPTPNTVYNELMTEYYRRVDYAFREFRNPGNPNGHETDQGEIYIKFGPPESTDRKFPSQGNVIEVWEYPNRTFVFEQSSGFGDFVLRGTD